MTTEDPTKLEAALAELEAEKQRRIDEKVAGGEAVCMPLTIVLREHTDVAALVEAEKARQIAKLRQAGDKREVLFDEPVLINTGVPRARGERE